MATSHMKETNTTPHKDVQPVEEVQGWVALREKGASVSGVSALRALELPAYPVVTRIPRHTSYFLKLGEEKWGPTADKGLI